MMSKLEGLLRISVVIPAHNDWGFTNECLGALSRTSYLLHDIILVDDGSSDGTAEHVARYFPQVHVLQGNGNLWWTGAMNLGIREALAKGAEYVLALNNDVVIAEEAIQALAMCAKEHPAAIIGSMIYQADSRNVIWCAGGDLKWPWPGEYMVGHGELDQGQYDGVRRVKWTPGMGTLMSKEILLSMKYYDGRNMPQYIADSDFTLRAGRAGYSVFVTSASKLYNHVENTGGLGINSKGMSIRQFLSMLTSIKSPEYWRARLTFIMRHCPAYLLVPALAIRYFRLVAFAAKRLMR